MRVRHGLLAALLVCVGGCATAPEYVEVERSKVIAQPFDQTWDNLVEFFATNSIGIRNIDRASGLLVAEQMYGRFDTARFSDWASCGTPGFPEVAEDRVLNLNVLARPDGPNTRLTVTAVFRERRSAGEFGSRSVECLSNGALEQLIFDRASD